MRRGLPGPLRGSDVFVGRDLELKTLLALWGEVAGGQLRAAFIGGEPGIGKTSLAAEVVIRTDAERVLYGRCDPDFSPPFQPFVGALSDAFGRDPAPLAGLAEDVLRHLGRVLPSLDVVDDDSQGQPDIERAKLFEAIGRAMRALGRGGPMLLVLDDLQWAEPPTVALLRHLLRASPATQALILGTYRTTELDRRHPLADLLADLRSDDSVVRISLDGLGQGEVESLVSASDPTENAERIASVLCERSGGNPFMVTELLREAHSSPALVMPIGVKEMVESRLGRLDETTRVVLQAAAVAGTTFVADVLVRTLNTSLDDVVDALDEAAAAGLIADAPPEMGFVHSLFRDVVLAGMSTTRRVRLHRQIGEGLESLGRHDQVEELAFHFTEAAGGGPSRRAATYALAAGRRALHRLAFEDAIRQLDRGLALVDDPAGQDLLLTCELRTALGWAYVHLGGNTGPAFEAGMVVVADAIVAGSVDHVIEAADLVQQGAALTDDQAKAGELIRHALSEPARWSERDRVRLQAQLVLLDSDAPNSEQIARSSVIRAREFGDDVTLVGALHALAAILSSSPGITERRQVVDELYDLVADDADRRKAFTWSYRADLYLQAADLDGVLAEAARLDAIAERTGWWEPRYLSMAFRAAIDLAAGDARRVLDRIQAMSEGGASPPEVMYLTVAYQLLAFRDLARLAEIEPLVSAMSAVVRESIVGAALTLTHAEGGQLDQARAELPAVVEQLLRKPRGWLELPARAFAADAVWWCDDAVQAARLRPLVDPYAGQLLSGGFGTLVAGLADRARGALAATQGDYRVGEEALSSAIAQAERLNLIPERCRAQAALARLLTRTDGSGDRDRAHALVKEAVASADALGLDGLRAMVASAFPY